MMIKVLQEAGNMSRVRHICTSALKQMLNITRVQVLVCNKQEVGHGTRRHV